MDKENPGAALHSGLGSQGGKLETEGSAPPAAIFSHAAERYIAYRRPSREDLRRIDRVVKLLGPRPVTEITQDDIVEAARQAYPRGAAPTTLNREIVRPAATILHYAAENRLCSWLRIKPFKEPKPTHKAVDQDAVAALIEAAPAGPKRLLVLWLFCQGTRISTTLKIQWSNIDLEAGTVRLYERKTDTWHTFPIHGEVLAILRATPPTVRTGRLFSWGDRHNVYRFTREVSEQVGVKFTAHMARHTLGTRLAELGASLRTIMDALGHADVKSSMRYQQPNLEVLRHELNRTSPNKGVRK